MDGLVEKILRKAIEDGSFDISSRKGDSLDLDESPFQEHTTRLTFHILKNAGMKPAWLENEIEIRIMLDNAREDLLRAFKIWGQEGKNWEEAENQFYHRMDEVNVLIRKLNLIVPLPRFQRPILKPKDELVKALANPQID